MREDSGLADSRGEPRDDVEPTAPTRAWVLAVNVLPGRVKQMGVGMEGGIKQTIALFGPSSPAQWAPLGPKHRALRGEACSCGGGTAVCLSASHCMASISPQQVLETLQEVLAMTQCGTSAR